MSEPEPPQSRKLTATAVVTIITVAIFVVAFIATAALLVSDML